MELFKGSAGIKVSFDELIQLIEHDMMDDVIELLAVLDATEVLTTEELEALGSEGRENRRISDLLNQILPEKFPKQEQ